MKNISFCLCLVLVMFGWSKASYASRIVHDVNEATKEVWFVPVVKVHNDLTAFSSSNYPATVATIIEPYGASINERTMSELGKHYPDYRIRMYALRLGSVKFRFVQAPDDSISYSNHLGGAWQAKSYKRIGHDDISEVHRLLKGDPGITVEVIYTKDEGSVFIEPEIEYSFTANYY